MIYPKTDYWDSLPVEFKASYFRGMFEVERAANTRIAGYWERESARVKSLLEDRRNALAVIAKMRGSMRQGPHYVFEDIDDDLIMLRDYLTGDGDE